MKGFFVTGTDTGVGKTVASAWLALHLDGAYWKPVQSGLEEPGGDDTASVRAMTGFEGERFHPPLYALREPLSPHEAARREGREIELGRFALPQDPRPLVVEGAGGVLVPLNAKTYIADLIAKLGLPAVLVCRSGLGTINHTLLSLEALRARAIVVAGIVMVGAPSPHNREALETYGQVAVLGEIPPLPQLNRETLGAVKPQGPLTEVCGGGKGAGL